MRRPLGVAFIALGLVAGCGGGGGSTQPPGRAVTAPGQKTTRLAAVRVRRGNPPRFALVTLDGDGSGLRSVVRAPRGDLERVSGAAWSPDAARLYFIGVLGEHEGDRFVYYESDLFVVDAKGGEPRRLTTSGDVSGVVPSPDGKQLLTSRVEHPGKRPFTSGLWLLDADGDNGRRLLEAKEGRLDVTGSWSPDGRLIAFTRCRPPSIGNDGLVANTCSVTIVSHDGSAVRALTERSSQPAFAPDGKLIAFVSDRDENGKYTTGSDEEAFANELYVVNAAGGVARRLTNTPSLSEESPAWSPDGTRIVFARVGPAVFSTQLMIVNADGTCATRVIGDAADDSLEAPSFEAPAVRPGPLTGTLPPLACD